MQPGDDPAFNLSKRVQNYDLLMTRRVRSILLVASRYDYFTFQGDMGQHCAGYSSEVVQRMDSLPRACSTRVWLSECTIPLRLRWRRYEELNLTAFPHITRVSSADEAFNRIENEQFDLVRTAALDHSLTRPLTCLRQVISLLRVGNTDIFAFVETIHKTAPGVPIVLLATTQVCMLHVTCSIILIARAELGRAPNDGSSCG